MPLLFSYGTLQNEPVQLSTFGRTLHGAPDELVGFEQSLVEVEDPDFVARSGKAEYLIVTFNGHSESRVKGVVFEISDRDLAKADEYEPPPYRRVLARLASGREAWVYADGRSALPTRAVAD
jgi:hypothetical protein